MSARFRSVLDCLTLSAQGTRRWTGGHQPVSQGRIYGGQLIAQSIRAAQADAGGREVRSTVTRFVRQGVETEPVLLDTDIEHSGRTFCFLSVRAAQSSGPVALTAVSMDRAEPGAQRWDDGPGVAPPERCTAMDFDMLPWEIRVPDGRNLGNRDVAAPAYRFWMRTPDPGDDPGLHRCLLAYATDLTLIGTALLPVPDVSQDDAGRAFRSAVTSHSLWFHQPMRTDEWLLIDQRSPIMAGGRAFGRGEVWSLDGRLLASFAQESVLRLIPQESDRSPNGAQGLPRASDDLREPAW